MNHFSFYSLAVLTIMLILDSANANPYFKSNSDRDQDLYDESKDDDDRVTADEINIVFEVKDTDQPQPIESEHRRHRERQTKRTGRFKQPRDRRQSWSTWDQGYSALQDNLYGVPNLSFGPANPDIYAGLYDAYVPSPATNKGRNFIPYPNQYPFQNNPLPQFVGSTPSVINNYFIAFPISSEPWRVGNPWFSAPFFFVPFCPPNQVVPTPEPTIPEPITPEPINPPVTPANNGSDLDNRGGFGQDQDNGSGNGNTGQVDVNRPAYRPVESPIDLTPAKPRHPLSRPPPPVDHSGGYDQTSSNAPSNAASNVRPQPNTKPRRPTTPPVNDFESNRISTPQSFPVRVSVPPQTVTTTPTPRPQVNAPSSCVLAITFCCVPNASSAYSRECLENLGCAGIFWDRNICNSEVVRAAKNAVNLYRQRTFQ